MSIPESWILWSVADMMAFLGCSRSTVYKHMADPTFPQAIRPSGGHPRWRAMDVKEWAARQITPAGKLTA